MKLAFNKISELMINSLDEIMGERSSIIEYAAGTTFTDSHTSNIDPTAANLNYSIEAAAIREALQEIKNEPLTNNEGEKTIFCKLETSTSQRSNTPEKVPKND